MKYVKGASGAILQTLNCISRLCREWLEERARQVSGT